MDPPSVDGLEAVPPSWRALTGLSHLTLTGHHSLRRLPHWIGELTCLRVRARCFFEAACSAATCRGGSTVAGAHALLLLPSPTQTIKT
jgi:hypothetical protein